MMVMPRPTARRLASSTVTVATTPIAMSVWLQNPARSMIASRLSAM